MRQIIYSIDIHTSLFLNLLAELCFVFQNIILNEIVRYLRVNASTLSILSLNEGILGMVTV